MAYELIETIEVGSGGAASIEFTSIPQDGVDLVLKLSARATVGGATEYIFNNDTGIDYARIILTGNGSSSSSSSNSPATQIDFRSATDGDWTANSFSNVSIYFSNYTSNTTKTISADAVSEQNSSFGVNLIATGSYDTTTGIDRIKISLNSFFAQYSTASLYKIY